MKAENFCYWLNGWFELNRHGGVGGGATATQLECIQNHLNMVFFHDIDPKQGDAKHQAKLNDLHVGVIPPPESSGGASGPAGKTSDPTKPISGSTACVHPSHIVLRC